MSQSVHPAAQPTETSFGERFSYSLYFAGQNIVYSLIQGFLAIYYVAFVQMRPAFVAALILGVRIWDAVNDPMIGLLMDRFRFLGKRFKGWINVSAVLMPLSTLLLFLVPTAAPGWLQVTWIIATYFLWDVLFTVSEVPSFGISTAMTRNEAERTKLLALTQIGSVLGVVIYTLAIAPLFEDGVDALNWVALAAIPVGLAIATMIPQMFSVRERHTAPVAAAANVPFRRMLREALSNDQHFIMMAFFTSQAFLNAAGVFAVFVAEYIYGNAQFALITQAITAIGIMVLGALSPAIVSRWGKRRFLEVSMLATLVFSFPVFFIPWEQGILALVFLGLRTMTLVVTSILRPMFTADCIEYGQVKNGIRNDGVAFSVQTFFNKTGDAIGQSLGTWILALVAYNELLPLAQQSLDTMRALHLWYIILPMIMAAVMYLGPKLFYRLDEPEVKEYIAQNAAAETTRAPEPDAP